MIFLKKYKEILNHKNNEFLLISNNTNLLAEIISKINLVYQSKFNSLAFHNQKIKMFTEVLFPNFHLTNRFVIEYL